MTGLRSLSLEPAEEALALLEWSGQVVRRGNGFDVRDTGNVALFALDGE